MAAITPLLTNALVTQGVSMAISQVTKQSSNNQALEQLQERQAVQESQAAADAQLRQQSLALDASEEEKGRKSALRRAVASQRANFGSSGIASGGGGSSEAVLLGLVEESQEDEKYSDKLNALKSAAIDQDLAQNKTLNVLQRTQLQERNNLSRLYSTASSIGKILG